MTQNTFGAQRERERERERERASSPRIKTTKVVYPQVYSYTLPDEPDNDGSQKIGYTERKDVDTRIREQTHTAAKQLRHEKLWSAPAFFDNKPPKDFTDKTFHKFLVKNGVQHRTDLGTEWFYFNGTPERSKQLFDTFRTRGFAALQNGDDKQPYALRPEQQAAVDQAVDYFAVHEQGEFLWNAKPRFGKTLASYDLVKRLGATKVLIVTNRPAIANSWFDDFDTFIEGYYFISDTASLSERKTLSREQYNQIAEADKPMITFLSLQDLKGSKYFGGAHDKLKWVADLDWDLLVIDEAHEGIDTDRTDAAFDIVRRSHTLHLSGTPFKALANSKFAADAIYNWTYLDEQKIKKAELEQDERGDHTDLPDLRLYTYRISQMTTQSVNEGIEIDDEARDYTFDLNEFFATKNQKFVHESDVREFLRNLSTNEKYPFSTPELRDELRHTFWYVGNRVESVKALEQLLKQDEIFKDYKVIVAAGDGKSFDEEEQNYNANEKSFDKVKKAIAEHHKTITLSCGQLTTGVTVKEWSAVLMLTDIKTPAQYMQAAFRAQNPYRFMENGELKAKKSAYLFDFAPTRVLTIYDTFANALNPNAVEGKITETERRDNIRELLNFFPVISEDVDGKMVELDAEKVLTFPNALAATEIVQARFMTNLLFNDNIKGVFAIPHEVETILDKMPVEKNKRVEVAKAELNLDDARKAEQQKTAKINENTSVILGEKIYRANIDRVVDNALNYETPGETIDTLAETVMSVAEPLIAKYKETYKQTNAEIDAVTKQLEEKTKLAVAEYESAGIKDIAKLKESLSNIIEHDFVETQVAQQETKKVETVQKTKEDEIRDRLRSFTRTIPMFVMANASAEQITIDNFDLDISDEDFVDLTNITKEEFHTLRDGFDYTTENGERKTFGGVFEKYRFNASIAEFVAEKQQRADYFRSDDDIFELIPNQKNNQIFTPRKVVQMMIDDLQREQPDLFTRTDSTFVDLYMKSGMYITEVVKRLFAGTRQHYSSDAECVRHILENQAYGLAPTGVLHGITTNYIFGLDPEGSISRAHFKQHDLLPQAKDNTAKQKLQQLFGKEDDMKFDAVVGNPPYQVSDNGGDRDDGSVNASASPVYNKFFEAAESLQPGNISFVMPARWLSGAGKGLGDFSKNMISDKRIKSFDLFIDSKKVFPSVDIKGGVCWFVWNENHHGKAQITVATSTESSTSQRYLDDTGTGVFIPFSELSSVLAKVRQTTDIKSNNMQLITSVRKPNGLSTDVIKNPAKYGLPKIYDTKQNDDDLELWGLENTKRVLKYLPKDYPLPLGKETIGKWKVFLPYAYGAGSLGEVIPTPILGTPILGTPIQACTETFLRIGLYDSEFEAAANLKYIKTKFFRALVGILKTTQHATTTFKLVPIQNFTPDSDIDWSKPVPEIDQQLYAKYGLDQTEINFIESRVREMA